MVLEFSLILQCALSLKVEHADLDQLRLEIQMDQSFLLQRYELNLEAFVYCLT